MDTVKVWREYKIVDNTLVIVACTLGIVLMLLMAIAYIVEKAIK